MSRKLAALSGLAVAVIVGLLLAWTPGRPLPPTDDPRIPAVVAWMQDRGFICAEDPDCLFDGARHIIAESEDEGIYALDEIIERSQKRSNPDGSPP